MVEENQEVTQTGEKKSIDQEEDTQFLQRFYASNMRKRHREASLHGHSVSIALGKQIKKQSRNSTEEE